MRSGVDGATAGGQARATEPTSGRTNGARVVASSVGFVLGCLTVAGLYVRQMQGANRQSILFEDETGVHEDGPVARTLEGRVATRPSCG